MSTVLIVQPDPGLNDEWCLALEASGHAVIAAAATTDGIERVREGGIDIIVVDTEGGSRGLTEFVTELQTLPDAPPFVLVSASPEAPQLSVRLGASGFIPKPCTDADLESAIGRLSPPVTGEFDVPTTPRNDLV